ncbi:MAG: DMT family transporter [Halobacteriales archaeon]
MRETTKGALLVFGAASGFGTIGIFGEFAVRIDLALATLLPVRFTVASAVVVGIAVARGWSVPRGRAAWTTLSLGVVYTAMTVLFFASLRHLTAGLAVILLFTYPAFVFVLSVRFLDEIVTRRTVAALALALAGVALASASDVAGGEPVGVALAMGAAVCYAIYTTGSRAVVDEVTPSGLLVGVLLGTTASMILWGASTAGLALPAVPREWGVTLGLALFGTVVPLLLFYEGVERLAASRVSVVSTAEPVVTVTLGVLLLDEPLTPAVVVSGVLVLGGALLVQREAGGEELPTAREPVAGEE